MSCALDKSTKRSCMRFLWACFFLYLISISIKMVFSAEMALIMQSVGDLEGVKTSLGLTFYYLAYAVGQLLLAGVMHKINIKRFMVVSIGLSALSFGAVPLFDSLYGLYAILFLNGFFQTGIWGGVMYFVGKYIPTTLSGFASAFLCSAFAIGTALTYGASAAFVALINWQATFVFFALLTVASLVVFLTALKGAEKKLAFVEEENRQAQQTENAAFAVEGRRDKSSLRLLVLLVLTITTSGSVYYAFMGWFPSLLIEVFRMPESYSLLLTLLLPACMAPAAFTVSKFSDRSRSNYSVAVFFSAVAAALLAVLCVGYTWNAFLTLALSVVMLFFLRGIINLTGAYFPLKLKGKVDSGKLSLLTNAFACLVAGVIPFISRMVVREWGWRGYFILITAIALLTLLLFLYGKICERRENDKE